MSKISFVYFDVGGVAIKDFSDTPKWDVMMHDMGLDKFDRQIVDDFYKKFETEIVIGKRHVDTLVQLYIKEFGITLDSNFSMQKYFLDHFDSNKSLWPIIAKLKLTSKVGLFTDQYPGLLDGIFARGIMAPVEWDIIIDSTLVGMKKPMPEIYKIAQEKAGVPGKEMLFIDNRKKNLAPATELGWQTFFYDSRDYERSSHKLAKQLGLSAKK